MREVNLPIEFIWHVTKMFFEHESYSPKIANVFSTWNDSNPESLENNAKKVNVAVDDLCDGDVVSAMKVLSCDENPFRAVIEEFSNPINRLRYKSAKHLSPEVVSSFSDVGLEGVINNLLTIDIYHSTPNLVDAVSRVLELYGFVNIETFWEASLRPPSTVRTRFKSFKEVLTPVILPYDDFTLVDNYVRGVEEMTLRIHHASQVLAKDGTYHARTLIGNSRLLNELPVVEGETLRMKYPFPGLRDPLALAFDDGFIVKFGSPPFEKFVYHPRILAEALADKLDKPKHLYFFYRAVGIGVDALERPDNDEIGFKAQADSIKLQFGVNLPSDYEPPETKKKVLLDFKRERIEVDLSDFLPILETENSKRIDRVMSLGNLWHQRVPYAMQSRLDHSIGVMYISRLICERSKIDDEARRKVELYALCHDWGHLTGSHATEVFFKAKMGFDHEEFAKELIKQNKDAVEACGVNIDDLVALMDKQDPLHDIVDGPFGADRIYFLSVDANEFGEEKEFDTLDLLPWLTWTDNKLVVDQLENLAFKFLDYRAQQYEKLYFSPSTQIADAYQRKMLSFAKLDTPFDEVHLQNHETLQMIPKGGLTLPFWRLSDQLLQYYLANHKNLEVCEIMRHLLCVYHKSPHASVAVLKISGYEDIEPDVVYPVYPELVYGSLKPHVECVSAEKLSEYHKIWLDPDNQKKLEDEVAKRSDMPSRHVVVAAVPNLKKLSSEYAPVRKISDVKSLFEWNPELKKNFIERANRMACLRVAVHPQFYEFAYNFFEKNSFADIVEETFR